jgi:hypothetical protein
VITPPAGAENPLDNERADVNADGVQCYVGPADASGWTHGWLLIPNAMSETAPAAIPDSAGVPDAVRVHQLVGNARLAQPAWRPSATGWVLTFVLPWSLLPEVGQAPFRFDLLVNERPAHRVRRRGQLILSGSTGEFVYLRGDRHDPQRAWVLHLVPPPASDPSPDSPA